ncbi:disheveled-associated activator of morphogenesis-like protein isoform X2 [Arctopsyche grandis]
MPPQDELDSKFAELVEELDLTEPNKTAMLGLPATKKWQIYCSRRPAGPVAPGQEAPRAPDDYVLVLRQIFNVLEAFKTVSEEELHQRVTQTDGLKTALRTSAHSFVIQFIDLDGLPAILDVLEKLDYNTAQTSLHTSLIGCLKALMNNSNGRAHVLSHSSCINTIAQSLNTENIKTKIAALEILGAVCLVPGGHKKVLEAMMHYQKYAFERTRFQGIINDLDKSTGIYRDEVNLKTAIMSFINAVLNYGPGVESLEFRLHLRYEFLMLGIQPVIDKLRLHENETLDRHIDFFEMVRTEDEKELARRYDKQHVDTKSATAMFDIIRRKISHTTAYPHLLSLLEHCLLLPLEYNPHAQHWLLMDRIIQQIVLQTSVNGANSTSSQENINEKSSTLSINQSEKGTDSIHSCGKISNPDVTPININVAEIVQLLAKEEELVAARTKAETLEKENTDMSDKLSRKEHELDLRSQEKEDLETSTARLKERLERETSAHADAAAKARQAEHRVAQLEHQVAQERSERLRFEKLVSEGSIPDDAKVINLKSSSGPETCFQPPPPPPPTPPCAPPPPPAAPFCPPPVMPPPPPKEQIKKNIPQPSNPLKSFNWSKLPDTKLHGTVWCEIDDTKLYDTMELDAIDKMFCAYQKNGVANDGSIEDLTKVGTKGRSKILSVIDGRRAQNCTILLSKLKMTDEEICRAILSMDSGEQLPIDMVEQLLKFTPSPEEAALLEEHQDELENLARADRFLYEISKIPHYRERVRSILFKKRWGGSSAEAAARTAAVLRASRQVQRSRRLRRLLEIVLALGNYMNRGARGNASGFRLASLNRLADTKSSQARNMTLLHYLVQILETKFKDVLLIEEDLPHVREASKVSLGQLEKDMATLRTGLGDIRREMDYHRQQNTPNSPDCFLPVMEEFYNQANCKFTELEDQFQDMKSRFEGAVRLFGEDAATAQPEEFFGALEAFLTSLTEARAENVATRRRQEEDEKRLKQEQELKKRTMERKQASSLLSSVSKSLGLSKSSHTNGQSNHVNGDAPRDNVQANGQAKGEFDDLISALRTGDVFGEDMAKFKRARKGSKASQKAGRDSPPRAICREDSRERAQVGGRN